jgi:shikimate kinase
MKENIYLIGMMGSGKTTIGKYLAQDLNYRFVDTDQTIEAKEKKPITKIFQESGETNFRKLETKILEKLSVDTHSVIATGGGIVEQRNNWDYLRQGLIVWLDVDSDETGSLADQLEPLLANRRSSYAKADIKISINQEQPPEEILAQIRESILDL